MSPEFVSVGGVEGRGSLVIYIPEGFSKDDMTAQPEPQSLYFEAVAEAERYKWIESEKAGHDLGRAAVEDWNRRCWCGWCRCRWLEHLQGHVLWHEFGDSRFGALAPERWPDKDLLRRVIRMIEQGRENLEILTWAVHERADLGTVVDILEIMDINSLREHPLPREHLDHAR